MTTARFCPSCGTLLPDVAQFCPKCGVDVQGLIPDAPSIPSTTPVYAVILPPSVGTHVPPVETSDPTDEPPADRLRPAERTNRQLYVIAAVVLLAAIMVGALLLGKMPMGGDRLERKNVNSDTIGEATAPSSSAPLGVTEQPPPPQAPPVSATDIQTSPNILGTSVATQPFSTAPGSVPRPVTTAPPMTSTPPLTRTPPANPSPTTDEPRVSADDAVSRLRTTVRDARGLSDDCISVASQGYVNTGYTFVVNDVCNGADLGRWRVDAKNGEVFRQYPDGRYMRP